MFSDSDLTQIQKHQLTTAGITNQIEKFKSGFPATILYDAATAGNGTITLSDTQADDIISYYENNLAGKRIVKFVPASGAATRMFKSLYAFLGEYKGSDEDYEKLIGDQSKGSVFTFFKKMEDFAFYEDLKAKHTALTGKSLEEDQLQREYPKILETLLNKEGLDYGTLPKGLLKFHRYKDHVRTPIEEHMVEGAQYAKDEDGNVHLHFTVSPDHQKKFEEHIAEVKGKYETNFGVKIHVTYSIQKPSTDTIAVDMSNNPFRNEDGSILFRPAGHGALLENLNDIDADIIFIKNIDNVVPDKLKEDTIRFKKAIAGILLQYDAKRKEALKNLKSGNGIEEAKGLLANHLGYKTSSTFDDMPDSEKTAHLKYKLNRPLRVCGMVKSDGDPGGGPFWVKSNDGSVSLQIVETAQIDLKGENQEKVFRNATHFNPADIVCMPKDAEGNKLNLMKYRDLDTGFITKKSKDGQDLKAQELPGLWNGSMADWNTAFVEIPVITFNPVKSVNDLLLDEHQG